MITDCSFLHVSEVGPVCDEISVRIEIGRGSAASGPYGCYIVAEEFSEGARAEAALQPEAV